MIDEASSTTTWETIVEQYRERAVRDDERIDELRQSTEHWADTAEMLMRQRDMAEEERDSWKIRAMQSEQQRQSLRDLLTIAEGQRDQAKADAEHWKGEWAVVMGQLGGARAGVDELLKDRDEAIAALAFTGETSLWQAASAANQEVGHLKAERDALRKYAARWYEHITLKAAIDAALAVQPTTGDKHE